LLRQNRVQHISLYPQRLPDWNPNAARHEGVLLPQPDGHPLELLLFPAGKG